MELKLIQFLTIAIITPAHTMQTSLRNKCLNKPLEAFISVTTVPTEQGVVLGERRQTITGETFYSFKGIPYAAPPTGSYRFKEPQPPEPWDGIRSATNHGNICPQVDIFSNELLPGNEDCLYLNVYTPNLKPELPMVVMFYIHGGGFKSGSGNDDNFGPDFFVAENVVLVTINYRLDALGFMSLESVEIPGNAGLKDQVAALKWVNKNIANFGGDPNQVTIFGQSAGGAACTLHALSPLSKGLFKRGIAMSGTGIHDFANNFEPRRRSFRLGANLDFKTDNDTALAEFLGKLPTELLVNTNPTILAGEEIINNIAKMYNFLPVVEKDFGQKRFLTEFPEVLIKNGEVNNIEFMLGYTDSEALVLVDLIASSLISTYKRYPEALVPTKIIRKSLPSVILKLADKINKHYFGTQSVNLNSLAKFVLYFSEASIVYDVIRYARALADLHLNNKIYLYRISSISERNVFSKAGAKYNLSGVAHNDDLYYLFQPYKYNLKVDPHSVSYKMIKQTTALFTNFAKYGNPTPDSSMGVTWPQYDQTKHYFMDIGEKLTISANPETSMMKFWKSIYDEAGLPF